MHTETKQTVVARGWGCSGQRQKRLQRGRRKHLKKEDIFLFFSFLFEGGYLDCLDGDVSQVKT